MEKNVIWWPPARRKQTAPSTTGQAAMHGQTFHLHARLITFFFCWSCLIAVLLQPQSSPAEQDETEPHLLFKKSVVVKEYKGGAVYSEPRTIKKGEYLWKILREYYNLPNRKIAFYCKIAKSINPSIKDINQLKPNQNMFVPYKYEKGKAGDEDVQPPFVHTVKSESILPRYCVTDAACRRK